MFLKFLSEKRFQTYAGIYVYCMDYHGGQFTRLYRLMSRISRKIKLDDRTIREIRNPLIECELDHAQSVYWRLKNRKAK